MALYRSSIVRIQGFVIHAILAVVCLSSMLLPSLAQSTVIDGWFDDWSAVGATAIDPTGDSTGPFDVTSLTVRAEGTQVFVRFRLAESCGLQNGEPGQTGLSLRVSTTQGRGLKLDFREKTVTSATDPGMPITWSDLNYACLPTYASDEYELCFDLSVAGIRVDDRVSLSFEGSDELAMPVSVPLRSTHTVEPKSTRVALGRSGDLRISCYNTMLGGMCDVKRKDSIGRLLSAVQSDVYCFVEETDEAGFRQAVHQLLPEGDRLEVVWRSGRGLATKFTAEPINGVDFGDQCAAVIGHSVIVIVAHLECCGYARSLEDTTRIEQALKIAELVDELQSGRHGSRYRDMPVVVVGDFNLVGSREPLGVLERRGGLTEARLLSTNGRNAVTWRSLQPGSYAPGRLDFMAYDASRLRRVGGGAINTEEMTPQVLKRLDLRSEDSRASDHLMIYADFATRGRVFTAGAPREPASTQPRSVSRVPEDANRR